MFEALGDIIDGPTGKRGGALVRRHSYAAGREGVFWRPTDRQTVRQIVAGARRYELATRQPGARNGALGFVALEVLELFANLVSFRTGRLDPSLEYLMGKLRRSKDAITRALKALRTHGFLDWLRRYVPTGTEGRGPQVQQTSNAYRLSLPARALRLLGRYGRPAPAPDDFTHRRARIEAGHEAYRAGLSPAELAREIHGDSALGDLFARWGEKLEQRESVSRSESRSKFLFYRD